MMGRARTGDPARRIAVGVLGGLMSRPVLWPTALAAVGRLARPGWWHRRPFLPLPDDRWWGFRMETAYGRTDADPTPADVLAYLQWCRRGSGGGRRGGEGLGPRFDVRAVDGRSADPGPGLQGAPG